MAQPLLKDPIVSAGPTRTGTGTGTLAVDKLTHFTTPQTYTLTCIATSPDALFSVSGSLDGPVGIAKVGTQFYDDDLKIFLTIQQGSTLFAVGDKFELTVVNGTDLNQDNIDDYDELPQKNFGQGVKGQSSGDNNVRYSDDDAAAELDLQSLKFTAVTPGVTGNDVQVQYLSPIAAVAATRVEQDLTLTAVTPGTGGNALTLEYTQTILATKGQLIYQDLTFRAVSLGPSGNAITMRYTTGATAGAEVVSVIGNAITVQIQSGVSTAAQIKTAIEASLAASALIAVTLSGIGTNAQTGPFGPTNLSGGANAIGDAGNEVVTVVGSAISVRAESGVSTAAQIKAKLDASAPATALATAAISGTGSNPQITPTGPTAFTGGVAAIGLSSPFVSVVANLIKVYFQSGVATATQVKAALDAAGAATALVSIALVGPGSDYQFSPVSALNLAGGESKFFSFNKHELTEPGDFLEGNASVRMQDAVIQGRASIHNNADFSGKVTLKDSSSNTVVDLQQYLNWLMQDQKVTLRTSDHSKVQWSKPDLTFEADIVIDFTDTDFANSVAVANSPINIPDGSSLYVILDRAHNVSVTPIVAATVAQSVNAFRIASRFGDNLILWDNTLVRDGKAVRIGEGGEGGTARVDLYDPLSTVLPTGPTATVDNVAVTNNMLVLFSNLSASNNRIYKASGVGTSIVWTAQSAWSTGLDPVLSDDVIITQGQAFGLQRGIYSGTDFLFNENVRYFSGTDYWEVSSLKTKVLAASTTANVFTISLPGSENLIVDYSIVRGSLKETGTLHVTSDGAVVALTTSGAYLGAVGVSFSADVVSGDLRVRYTADATAGVPTMKYFVRRWSDSAGGPGGVPSYSGATSSGIGAAGSNSQIQYNDTGDLGADANFTWDKTAKVFSIDGLSMTGMAIVTLADGVMSPTTAFQYNATNFPFMTVEFSIKRDGQYQLGRMLITNNGTDVTIAVDFVNAGGDPGVTFMADINAGQVRVQYISTATTFNAQLKYSVRRWS